MAEGTNYEDTRRPPVEPNKLNRRNLMKGGAAVAISFLLANKLRGNQPVASEQSPADFLAVSSEPDPFKERSEILRKLNEIKNLPLMDEGRMEKEKKYVAGAKTIEESDAGFSALGRKIVRADLIEKRYGMREKGEQGLQPLSKEQIEWANAEGIHPEILGICLETQDLARQVIDSLKPRIRDDFKGQEEKLAQIPGENFMLTPGGMARLICEETGGVSDRKGRKIGFSFIGGGLAKDQYDGMYKESGGRDLAEVCGRLKMDTGIDFTVENTQGSQKPPGHESGGAIGIQMMPGTVLELYDLLYSVPLVNGDHLKFNPFDPTSSVLGAWVKLAQRKYLGVRKGEPLWRYGVYQGKDNETRDAIAAWNPFDKEITQIFNSEQSYRAKFPPQAA